MPVRQGFLKTGLQGSMLSKNTVKKRGLSENQKNFTNSNYDIADSNPLNLIVNDTNRRAHSKNDKYEDSNNILSPGTG